MMLRELYRKEVRAFFFTPAAYVVAAAFLLIAGWMFATPLFLTGQATLNGFFLPLPVLLSFFAPAVSMRLFAEEAKTGTIEALLALPATEWELVGAKYAAAMTVVLGALALTLPYALSVGSLGSLDWGATALGYLGVALCAALMTAAGTFASTLTRNQVVAFILGFAFCFSLALTGNFADILPYRAGVFATFIGTDSHLRTLTRGTLDLRDVVYFVSGAALLLYGARVRVGLWRR